MSIPATIAIAIATANERNIGMILGKCDVKSEWDKESGIVYQFQEVAEYIKDNYRCEPDLEIIYECLGFWYNDNLHYGVYHDGDTEYDCVLYDDLGCDFLNYPYSESDYHCPISIIYIDENNKIIINDVSFSSLMIEGYLMEDDEGVVCRWTKKDGWVSVYGDTDDESDEEEDC